MQVSGNCSALQHLFRYFEPKELAINSTVCKLWYQAISDENFMRYLLLREYPPKILSALDIQHTYRQLYQSLQYSHRNLREWKYKISDGFLIERSFLGVAERSPNGKHELSVDYVNNAFTVAVLKDQETRHTCKLIRSIVAAHFLNDAFVISASTRVVLQWKLFEDKPHKLFSTDEISQGITGLEVIHKTMSILIAFESGKIEQRSHAFEPMQSMYTSFDVMKSLTPSLDENFVVITGTFWGRSGCVLQLWDLNDWKRLRFVTFQPGIACFSKYGTLHYSFIDKVQFSQDGSKLHLCSLDDYEDEFANHFAVTLNFSEKTASMVTT